MNLVEGDRHRDKEQKLTMKVIGDMKKPGREMMDEFNKARHGLDHIDIIGKQDLEQTMIRDFERHGIRYYGRMSPLAKEHLYRRYLKGETIKELSLSYGILV
jgi:hypothetical protein